MKLTKSKNAQRAEFHRDINKGVLRNGLKPKTREIINGLDLKRSYTGRILKMQNGRKNKPNPFMHFVNDIINGKIDTLKLPKCSNIDELEAEIDEFLSEYGKNLRYNENSKTLKELVLEKYKTKEPLKAEFELLNKRINELIEYKKGKLERSIENNRVPFEIEKGKLEPSSQKMQWLFSFITASGLEKGKFELYKKEYDYTSLAEKISQLSEEYLKAEKEDRNSFLFSKLVYDLVSQYNHEIYEKYKINHVGKEKECKEFSFFVSEVKNHFKKYFLPKNKGNRISSLKEIKNIKYYCSEEFVFSEVWRHIVNQITAGLIQYGKLQHYFYENNEWNKELISSDGLTFIQKEEAFKKQMFMSLAWSATRLNYFYNYGGANADMLNKKAYNNQVIKGDILLELSSYYNNKNSGYIDDFFKIINSDEEQKEIMHEKVATAFPLDENDSDEKVEGLLEETYTSIYRFRNNLFHYKNNRISELLVDENNQYPISREFLQRDIDNIQEGLKEQIRSMNLAEYYSLSLLKDVFRNLGFRLYASQFPMMPSFNNVYKKGINLYKTDEKHKGLYWFVDIKSNKELSTYKNILQLIYYHSFLPEIASDSRLITDFIESTKLWNKIESVKKQTIENKNRKARDIKKGKVNGKYSVNEKMYRYANMPTYKSDMTLEEYFSSLQRQQSVKEKENIEEKPDKENNYYLDFIQDIFVRAFDNYLEQKLSHCRRELTSPKEQEVSVDEILNNLFKEDYVKMYATIKSDTPYITIYPFLRMLDASEVNKLQHQFIRYRSSSEGIKNDIKAAEEIMALVQFTIPSLEEQTHYEKCLEKFSCFVEGDMKREYQELYYQSDKATPIMRKNIALISRLGALELYKDMFRDDYRINGKEYRKYKDMLLAKPNDKSSLIEQKQNRLNELHEKLVKINPKSLEKSGYHRNNYEEYKSLVMEVQDYNKLNNKLTFESLYQIHRMHIDILGRFASFAEDWERDMFFMLTALRKLEFIDIDVEKIFTGSVVSKLNNKLKKNTLFFNLCWCNEEYDENMSERIFSRNAISHLNHITQVKREFEDNELSQLSIMNLLERIRILLAYDIKRQNAVTKVLKEVLKDYKINLSLKRKKGESDFEIDTISSGRISHLKNLEREKIDIDAWDDNIVKIVRRLLEFSYDVK